MTRKFAATCVLLLLLVCSLSSCVHQMPKDALALSPESLKDRQLQTRLFDTTDEAMLLTASAAVLQDSGYTIEESEVALGVIVASRDRDVTETHSAVCFFCFGVPYDQRQRVFVSLVSTPVDDNRTAVRITFQHMVWNNQNAIVKNEQIRDSQIYQQFFAKLSKSVFLIANEI